MAEYLKTADQLKEDDIIDTQFSDGTVKSRVIEKKDEMGNRKIKGIDKVE